VTAEQLQHYPPPIADGFRALAASIHGVEAQQVIATNGGDELLRLAVSTFVEPGQAVGVLEPSYSLYRVLADLNQSPAVRVPLAEDWSCPADAARTFNEARAKLVFVTNPHAPSGRLTPVVQLSALAGELDALVVVDEAYVDFVDPDLGHDAVPLVSNHENVLILRTLSKGYSLAGLRFGYGIGAPGIIEPMLTKTRDSYNVGVVGQRLAVAALESRDRAAQTWEAVRRERTRLREALAQLGLDTPPSQSNFLLATVPDWAGHARTLCDALEDRGVLVRHFDQGCLRDKLRITVGTPTDTDRLLGELKTCIAAASPIGAPPEPS